MAREAKPPLGPRHLAALRALGARPGGLDRDACPSATPTLVDHGYVMARTGGKPGWVLTSTGRFVVANLDLNSPLGTALPHERLWAGELPLSPMVGGPWRSKTAPWLHGDPEGFED